MPARRPLRALLRPAAGLLLVALVVAAPLAHATINTLTFVRPGMVPPNTPPPPQSWVPYYATQRQGSQGTGFFGSINGDSLQLNSALGPVQVADLSATSVAMGLCPIGSAAVVAGPAEPNTGASGADVTCTSFTWVAFPGTLASGAGELTSTAFPVFAVVGPGAGHHVVVTCVSATLLDTLVGTVTSEQDLDFFVARDPSDPSLAWVPWATSVSNWANFQGNTSC